MTDPYARLAAATGDTAPISPKPMPGASRPRSFWDYILDAFRQSAQWKVPSAKGPAAAGAYAGSLAGGGSLKDAAGAAKEAAKAPLSAPTEMARAAAGLSSAKWATDWMQKQGRVVGIYGLFVILGVIGLVFLLSAAGEGRVGGIVRKAVRG